MRDIFKIIFLGYGISLEWLTTDHECNPNKKDYTSDGSISKNKFYYSWYRFSNPYVAFHFLWNYRILIRLHLNRG